MLTRNSTSFDHIDLASATADEAPIAPSAEDRSLALRMNYTHPQLGVLTASGDLDSITTPRLATLLWPRLRSKLAGLVLDFREMDFLGVAALELLSNAHAYSRHRDVRLSIVSDTPAVRSALRAAGLDDLLPRYSNVSAALGEHEGETPALPV